MSAIPSRLDALRAAMREHGLTHYVVPSSDEHLNEYLPDWRMRRPWITGFDGSAGDAVIGLEEAWLFTDGRYHLQAEQQLAGTGVQLSKVGAPGHPTLIEYLRRAARAAGGQVAVGCDPMILAVGAGRALDEALRAEGAALLSVSPNLIDPLWTDRPAPARTPLVAAPLEWVAPAAADKLTTLRKDLEKLGANAIPVVKLDQLAWLLNLRSKDDVPFNPVFEGYAWVDADSVQLFLHGGEARVPASVAVSIPNLSVHAYEEFAGFLERLPAGTRAVADPSSTTLGVLQALEARDGVAVVDAPSPVESAKALKSKAEIESMRRANRRASAAKVRALQWLDGQLAAGAAVTERAFQERIEADYRALPDYWGLSFNTISAAGPNGAIMHYGSADETPLESGKLFLIDSGAQVGGGTTDDTRTVAVGEPTAEQRRLYTLVLKCHASGAMATFPAGTAGTAIDTLTRAPLWRESLNYDHGTGHGVGCFLNVHEGPFALAERERKPYAVHPLHAGMVTSIEPGYYLPGWGGIRLENLYLIAEDRVDDLGVQWLRFEPLTFIPFDERLIDRDLLDARETAWLDEYTNRVREELAQELAPEEAAALA